MPIEIEDMMVSAVGGVHEDVSAMLTVGTWKRCDSNFVAKV